MAITIPSHQAYQVLLVTRPPIHAYGVISDEFCTPLDQPPAVPWGLTDPECAMKPPGRFQETRTWVTSKMTTDVREPEAQGAARAKSSSLNCQTDSWSKRRFGLTRRQTLLVKR